MSDQLDSELNRIAACAVPTCRAPVVVNGGSSVPCPRCGERYRRLRHVVDFTPSEWRQSAAHAEVWGQLQDNGLVSYTQDPDHNLGVGDRPDYLAFSRFCRFDGLVLDIGCGPQPWPTHFKLHAPGTRFVGVDPLVPDAPASFVRVRGLGEFLPFQDEVFDQVVFATSLDHFLDTRAALREARRVCKPEGYILVFSGEKKPGAPRPAHSPQWYRNLVVPPGAEDPFHFKRFSEAELEQMMQAEGLVVQDHEAHPIDAWRTNHYYRIASRN